MRVFAFEYLSGGGLAGRPLPPVLAREGDLMLRTLVGELAEVPGVEVITSRDPRLPPLAGCRCIDPLLHEDLLALYRRGLAAADAAWPTAPETGQILERLAQATLDADRVLLGCRPGAIRLAASKRAASLALRESGIEAVPTFGASDPLPPLPGPWVVKPDDGAGCENTQIVEGWRAAMAMLADPGGTLVAQPWVEGDPLSLSLLCAGGEARLLSCNRQVIALNHAAICLRQLEVNAVRDDGRYTELGGRIAAAIAGLWGYVGVDLVRTSAGLVVLEINPRLTTSYCGLPDALGSNVAALVLDLAERRVLPPPSPGARAALVQLEPAHAI